MEFKKYKKIHRLGVEENDGILDGKCYIQEKVDGANTSIWLDDGIVQCGSRGRHLTGEGFNGFVPYAQSHVGIKELLNDFPGYRLWGEWLVCHTIKYSETAYKQWYLFDIDDENGMRLSFDEVLMLSKKYKIKTVELFAVMEKPSLDDIQHFVGQSSLGEIGEGVVIKNFGFINEFGDTEYAKVVTEKFKENNALVFGGNNKHSDTYWEMFVVNKYITLERVRKIMQKIQPTENRRLNITHTARVINSTYHDMITEEIWEIQKKVKAINLKKLQHLSCRKAAQIYHDILNDDISVADKK